VLSCSKNTPFRAYSMPIYSCQLWSKYTQVSMKRLRAAYNNAYGIMHYISRNVSVRAHEVTHCVNTFDALLRNNMYRIFIQCAHLHLTLLFDRFKCLMLFTNLRFSSTVQSSCMMETNCSSCWCMISVFVSHHCCFCVICSSKKKKMCVQCIQTKHTKSKC